MKILLYGDSITDAGREASWTQIGVGYPAYIAGELLAENPEKYEVVNRGISGNRIVDLYARIKRDVWNHKPDVFSILIGINDIWHGLNDDPNDVELERFVKVYRMLIEDTLKVLPNVKIMLCEPFVLKGCATENTEEVPDRYERFCEVYQYAAVVKKLAEEFNVEFLPLQEKFTQAAQNSKAEYYLADGVHPHVAGAKLIADEWMQLFQEKVND